MTMTKEYRRELRQLKAERQKQERAARREVVAARRDRERAFERASKRLDRAVLVYQLGNRKLNRRIAILEGRLS